MDYRFLSGRTIQPSRPHPSMEKLAVTESIGSPSINSKVKSLMGRPSYDAVLTSPRSRSHLSSPQHMSTPQRASSASSAQKKTPTSSRVTSGLSSPQQQPKRPSSAIQSQVPRSQLIATVVAATGVGCEELIFEGSQDPWISSLTVQGSACLLQLRHVWNTRVIIALEVESAECAPKVVEIGHTDSLHRPCKKLVEGWCFSEPGGSIPARQTLLLGLYPVMEYLSIKFHGVHANGDCHSFVHFSVVGEKDNRSHNRLDLPPPMHGSSLLAQADQQVQEAEAARERALEEEREQKKELLRASAEKAKRRAERERRDQRMRQGQRNGSGRTAASAASTKQQSQPQQYSSSVMVMDVDAKAEADASADANASAHAETDTQHVTLNLATLFPAATPANRNPLTAESEEPVPTVVMALPLASASAPPPQSVQQRPLSTTGAITPRDDEMQPALMPPVRDVDSPLPPAEEVEAENDNDNDNEIEDENGGSSVTRPRVEVVSEEASSSSSFVSTPKADLSLLDGDYLLRKRGSVTASSVSSRQSSRSGSSRLAKKELSKRRGNREKSWVQAVLEGTFVHQLSGKKLSDKKDSRFIRVSPDGRYLVIKDGKKVNKEKDRVDLTAAITIEFGIPDDSEFLRPLFQSSRRVQLTSWHCFVVTAENPSFTRSKSQKPILSYEFMAPSDAATEAWIMGLQLAVARAKQWANKPMMGRPIRYGAYLWKRTAMRLEDRAYAAKCTPWDMLQDALVAASIGDASGLNE
jgi:hypothetical protein